MASQNHFLPPSLNKKNQNQNMQYENHDMPPMLNSVKLFLGMNLLEIQSKYDRFDPYFRNIQYFVNPKSDIQTSTDMYQRSRFIRKKMSTRVLVGILGVLAIGAVALGIASLLQKPKCPTCKTVLTGKPTHCPQCGSVLIWRK